MTSRAGELDLDRPRAVFGAAIERGSVPDAVPQPVFDRPWLSANRTEAVFSVDAVARYHVRRGRRIVVEAHPTADPTTIDMWTRGTVAALVLVQQQRFALHASVVLVGDTVVALAGDSGAGKSTTATRLSQRGHALLGDDVVAVDLDDGVARVDCLERPLHLWLDAAERLGVELSSGRRLVPARDKYAFDRPVGGSPPRPQDAGRPAVDLVVVLSPAGTADTVRVDRLTGVQAVSAARRHTYRRSLSRLQPERYFQWVTELSRAAVFHELARPVDGWSLDAVVDALEAVVARSPMTPAPGAPASGGFAIRRQPVGSEKR